MTGDSIEDDLRKITRLLRQLRSKLRGLSKATDAAPSVLSIASHLPYPSTILHSRNDEYQSEGPRQRVGLQRTIKYTRRQQQNMLNVQNIAPRATDVSFPTPIKKPAQSLLSFFQATIERFAPAAIVHPTTYDSTDHATGENTSSGQVLSLQSLACFAVGRLICAARDYHEQEDDDDDSFATDEDWYEIIPSHLRRMVLFEHVVQILIKKSLIPTMIPVLITSCLENEAYVQGFELLLHYWCLIPNHGVADVTWSISEATKLQRKTEWMSYLARWILRVSLDQTRLSQVLKSLGPKDSGALTSSIINSLSFGVSRDVGITKTSNVLLSVLLFWFCHEDCRLECSLFSTQNLSWLSILFFHFWDETPVSPCPFLQQQHVFLIGLLLLESFSSVSNESTCDTICQKLETLLMNDSCQFDTILSPKTIPSFQRSLESLQRNRYISLSAALVASLLNGISNTERGLVDDDVVSELKQVLQELQIEFEDMLEYIWGFEPVLGQYIPQKTVPKVTTNEDDLVSQHQVFPSKPKQSSNQSRSSRNISFGRDPLLSSSPVRGPTPIDRPVFLQIQAPTEKELVFTSPTQKVDKSPLGSPTPKPLKRRYIEDFDPIFTPIPKKVQIQVFDSSRKVYQAKMKERQRIAVEKENVMVHQHRHSTSTTHSKKRMTDSPEKPKPTVGHSKRQKREKDSLYQNNLPSDLDDLLAL